MLHVLEKKKKKKLHKKQYKKAENKLFNMA